MAIRRSLVAAAVILLVLQAVFNLLFLIPMHRISVTGLSDYFSFYSAGKIVLEGNRARLYDRATQASIQRRIAPRVHFRSGALVFYHPAYEALSFALLALWPFAASYYLWAVINVILFVLTLHVLKPHVHHLLSYSRLLPLGIALSFYPLFEGVMEGQDSVPLLLVFVLSLVALKRERPFAAGCLLSLGLFKFQFVIPFLVPFAFNKQTRRVFWGACAMAAILVAISVSVTGIPGAVQYVHLLLLDTQSPEMAAVFPWMMPNWRGLIASTVGIWAKNPTTGVVIATGSLLLVAFSAYAFRRWWSRSTLDLLFSLDLVIAILASYHANLHDLTLLLVPFWLVGNHLAAQQVPQRGIAIAIGSVLLATPVYFVSKGSQQVYWLGLAILAAAYMIAMLTAAEWKEFLGGRRKAHAYIETRRDL